jgi:hypothetical protein
VALSLALGSSLARAEDKTMGPWTAMGQVGGTAGAGRMTHYADGHRISTGDISGDDAWFLLDARASLTRAFGRSFALTGQLGVTNWQSEYRAHAGYRRSNFLSLGLSPELRLPIGRCRSCPVVYLGPRGAFVLSILDQHAPRASVQESGRAGLGALVGGRLGIQLRIHRRLAIGLKLEHGFEKVWLRHGVHLSGIGEETQRYVLLRAVHLIGFWWAL